MAIRSIHVIIVLVYNIAIVKVLSLDTILFVHVSNVIFFPKKQVRVSIHLYQKKQK